MVERRRYVESANEKIDFNAAVKEAKTLLTQISQHHLRIGELADKLEPVYGEGTLARFAKAIGLAACTVERYRDVFRAWKEIPAARRESVSYAVLRELATHHDRAALIEDNPKMTSRQAREHKLAHSAKQQSADDAAATKVAESPAAKNNKRVVNEILDLNGKLIKAAKFASPGASLDPEMRRELRVLIKPKLSELIEGRKAYGWLIDDLFADGGAEPITSVESPSLAPDALVESPSLVPDAPSVVPERELDQAA